jgi:protein involved in temperature-dependent protein secretion
MAGSRSVGSTSSLLSASGGEVLAGVVEEESPCIRKSSDNGMEAADDVAENGKHRLVENDMTGDDNAASGHVKTAVALVGGWVTEEDTRCGPRCEFVGVVAVRFG